MCIYILRVCSVYWNPQQRLLNVFENKLLIPGWAGKGSKVQWFLENVKHIDGTHQIPYLFYLWLSGLEKKRLRVFRKQNLSPKLEFRAKLPDHSGQLTFLLRIFNINSLEYSFCAHYLLYNLSSEIFLSFFKKKKKKFY